MLNIETKTQYHADLIKLESLGWGLMISPFKTKKLIIEKYANRYFNPDAILPNSSTLEMSFPANDLKMWLFFWQNNIKLCKIKQSDQTSEVRYATYAVQLTIVYNSVQR